MAFSNFRRTPCQFIFLTATLPPSMWASSSLFNHLSGTETVVRAPSNRLNTRYTIQRISGSFLDSVVRTACDAWSPDLTMEGKAILFAWTVEDAKVIPSMLCPTLPAAETILSAVKSFKIGSWTPTAFHRRDNYAGRRLLHPPAARL
ncbi:hypothetical protein K470DRAFT_104340 [Piedraia hortae CBS 480.64]|uniref:Helicase ATP-binding domain-containing protein n=1 Tax=Piedraia hortae CBS 480.64 TaxID=1314780 RepID=A0A6A7C8J0_9PEZI|nr:hypothetical protein K470DRAFT_104340 [Piedraia hortae CBS 480.64]